MQISKSLLTNKFAKNSNVLEESPCAIPTILLIYKILLQDESHENRTRWSSSVSIYEGMKQSITFSIHVGVHVPKHFFIYKKIIEIRVKVDV